jgi:hypothetical protein
MCGGRLGALGAGYLTPPKEFREKFDSIAYDTLI